MFIKVIELETLHVPLSTFMQNKLVIVQYLRKKMQKLIGKKNLSVIFQSSNRLVKEVGNAAKETDLTFKYKAKDPKKKIEKSSLPFQVGYYDQLHMQVQM